MASTTKSVTTGSYLEMFLGLQGKVALVTGSTAGLGRAMAETLCLAGCHVIVNGRYAEKTEEAAEELRALVALQQSNTNPEGGVPRVFASHGDTSKPDQARQVVERIKETYGRLDILVNNAGMNLPEATFEEQFQDNNNWAKISSVNIEGPMEMIQLTLPLLKESSAGRIINVSSILGHVAGPSNPLYSVTKAAMLNLTKTLAAELAMATDSNKITVNSISPGAFDTAMNAKFTNDDTKREAVERNIPMGRLGQPHELAGAVLYLASAAASYTTGTDILVDGGYTAV